MTGEQATTVFVGGNVFSGHATVPRSTNVAVRDGRISAIGDVAPFVGPNTTVVDISGRLLVPGFQDAHIHPILGGLERVLCHLGDASDGADCLRIVAAYAEANPTAEWIVGGGWSLEFFPGGIPTRQMLDTISPDRPVALDNRDHHGIWVNSLALKIAGIDRRTPDPVDGRIERDPSGEPSGMLHEGAAQRIKDLIPLPSAASSLKALMEAQSSLHSVGVTTWQDALLSSGVGSADPAGTYLDALHTGLLTMKVRAAILWDRHRGLEQIEEITKLRKRVREADPGGRVRADGVKIMVDGVTENFTAALSQPYRDACGHQTTNSGLSFIAPESLNAYVVALDREGFDLHFHALGDRAVTETLDALTAARSENGPSVNRHHLAHLLVVDPTDIARFKTLGAAANTQMLWAGHGPQIDELNIPFMAPEFANRLYPFGELAASGATMAAGSDWPVSSPDPLAAIHVGVNRSKSSDISKPLGGHTQTLTLAQALAAHTTGSAWANHVDHESGEIRLGYDADLVVLDRNIFDTPHQFINHARVLRTYARGTLVYER